MLVDFGQSVSITIFENTKFVCDYFFLFVFFFSSFFLSYRSYLLQTLTRMYSLRTLSGLAKCWKWNITLSPFLTNKGQALKTIFCAGFDFRDFLLTLKLDELFFYTYVICTEIDSRNVLWCTGRRVYDWRFYISRTRLIRIIYNHFKRDVVDIICHLRE